jgi:hypothetical protein
MVGAVSSRTPAYGFAIIRYDSVGWHSNEHDNWKSLDAVLSAASNIPSIRGVWQNSVTYAIGERVADSADSTVWRCMVAHTSASSGTFAAARIANPTYWEQVTSVPEYRGAWVTAASYGTNDIVTINNAWYVGTTNHISGVFASDLAALKWALIVDTTAAIAAAAEATTQAGIATTQAGIAATQAGIAAAQVTLAAAQVTLATTQAGLAATSAADAATQVGLAEDQVDLAADQVDLAAAQVTAAAAQVTLATTQATNAATSATTATTQAGIATTQAGVAATQAGNAATEASDAAASAAAAALSAAKITIATTAPSSPALYDLWVDVS